MACFFPVKKGIHVPQSDFYFRLVLLDGLQGLGSYEFGMAKEQQMGLEPSACFPEFSVNRFCAELGGFEKRFIPADIPVAEIIDKMAVSDEAGGDFPVR
jgi:hypothetical protein